MSIKPSPHADRLEKLTTAALDAFNRAIETELIKGRKSQEARHGWWLYRRSLYSLGRATNDAIAAEQWRDISRDRVTYKTRKAS